MCSVLDRGDWARTGTYLAAAGKQNEFVSASRILYFYSHDHIYLLILSLVLE